MSYEISDFTTAINMAQTLHSRGNFADAQTQWLIAEAQAPDPIEQGRAIRGDAASSSKLGEHEYAIERAQEALNLHTEALRTSLFGDRSLAGLIDANREKAQSHTELGRVMLVPIIARERRISLSLKTAREQAQPALTHFDQADQTLVTLENDLGQVDQYRINLLSRLATGHALYGNSVKGRFWAIRALQMSGWSESRDKVAHAGNLPFLERGKAKARAIARGSGALAVSLLTSSESTAPRQRQLALAIASDRRFGL